MKQPYIKPLIAVEDLTLDRPIAQSCSADPGDIASLKDIGYIVGGDTNCQNGHVLDGGGIDCDFDGKADFQEDTVCYHSNVQTVLTS